MNLIVVIGSLAAVVSAIFGILYYKKSWQRENPRIEMGFARGDECVDESEIRPQDDTQQIFFRIKNASPFSIKMPICSVKFPEILKHRTFVDREGERQYGEGFTVNSDLWGLGKGTTNINMNLPDSMWEIYGMPTLFLRSKESIEFFVRFTIPKTPRTYSLEIKLDAEGAKGFTRKLKLCVNPN